MSRHRPWFELDALEKFYGSLEKKLVVAFHEGKGRRYEIFDSPLQFVDRVGLTTEYMFAQPCHDISLKGQTTKMAIDLDMDGVSDDQVREDVLYNVVRALQQAFCEMFVPRTATDDMFWVTDNDGKTKGSKHIYLQVAFADQCRGILFERTRALVKKEYRGYMDGGLYSNRHALRTVRTCKMPTAEKPEIRYKIARHQDAPATHQRNTFLRHKLRYLPPGMESYEIYLCNRPAEIPGFPAQTYTREEYNRICQKLMIVAELRHVSLTHNYACPVLSYKVTPTKRNCANVATEVVATVCDFLNRNETFANAGYVMGPQNGSVIPLLRQRPGFCCVCQKVHDAENGCIIVSEHQVFVRCHRAVRAVPIDEYLAGNFDGSLYVNCGRKKRRTDDWYSQPQDKGVKK